MRTIVTRRGQPGTAFLLAAGAALLLAACADTPATQTGPAASAAPPPQPAVVSSTAEMVAAVDQVDRRTRTVVLRGPNDRPVTVKVGPEVRNFDQIRRGDRVRVRYEEALAVALARPGTSADPRVGLATARAPAGERPGAAALETTRARVRVDAIDLANNTVTFTPIGAGPGGTQRVAKVRRPEMQEFLRGLRVGDEVDVAFAEALAISVEPAER
jgi:hypothetical protein